MNRFIFTIHSVLEEKIKESIEKEIALLRELLGNFLQEEMSLLNQDKLSWGQVMQDRFALIEEIKQTRNDRALEGEYKESPSCTTLFLTDQLLALLQKIHQQTNHNENLLSQLQHLVAIPSPIPYPERLALTPRKKTTLLTLP